MVELNYNIHCRFAKLDLGKLLLWRQKAFSKIIFSYFSLMFVSFIILHYSPWAKSEKSPVERVSSVFGGTLF